MKKFLVVFLGAIFLAAASASAAETKGLQLEELSGQKVNIGSFTADNAKPMLLLFWTSWCPFCMNELKTLNRRQQQIGDAAVLFAVNAGESKGIVERVVRSNKLEIRMLLDQKMEAVDAYGVVGVPTFVLVDTQGKVVFKDNFFPEAEIKKLTRR